MFTWHQCQCGQLPAMRARAGSWIVAVLVSLVTLGCATTHKGNESAGDNEKIQTLWPEPPEQPRLAFRTYLRSLADIKAETEKERFEKLMTGQGVSTDVVYEKPSSVAARSGRVYVADPPSRSVIVFDVPRGRVFRFGVREPHVLQRPNSLAIDDEGRVYVLDTKTSSVMVYDRLGLFLFSVGKSEDLTKPVGLAVSHDGKRIYVVDRGSLGDNDHRVVVYAPSGDKIQVLGPRGKREGEFNIPLEAAVAPDGSLVVLDSGNFRVQVFDSEGRFVRAFGSAGNGVGQFSRPRGLTTDSAGNIYVSDAGFNNVQIFDPEGQLLLTVGGMNLNPGPGRFGLIGALASDERDHIYVVDTYFKKIEVYGRLSDEEGRALMQPR